jgi:leucyl/phenylalanyl-tRNA--protein transferase
MLTRAELSDVASLFSEGIEPEPALAPAARRRRRLETLRESVPAGARRFLLVVFNLLRPRRLIRLPATLELMLRDRTLAAALPDPRAPIAGVDGFVGLAPDLSPATMMEAYGRGLAPSASVGPIAWHSPPSRLIAAPSALAPKLSARVVVRSGIFRVTFDQDVDSVLAASANHASCASLAPERLAAAFAELFDAGYGHTFEVRDAEGEIVGGGYGVAVGRVFVLERMFSRRAEAAMAGLARLAQSLRDWDFALIECGAGAAALAADAFDRESREEYLAALAGYMGGERVGRWPSEGARAPRRQAGREARAA